MANLNKVILVGNFTRDVEVQHTNSGLSYTRYTIAVDRPMNRDGKRGVDFSSCVAFGKMADNLSKLGKKGRLVYIEGYIRSSSYEDRNGNRRASMNVATNNFEILTPRSNSSNSQSNDSQNTQNAQNDNNEQGAHNTAPNHNTANENGSNGEQAKNEFAKNSQEMHVSDDSLPF